MDLDALGLGTNFTAIDWAIVAVYLTGTVAIGLYANRYVANMSDYIVAGRSLKSYLAIATMIGTELGLVTVMYSSQKGFTAGFAAFHIGLVAGVVTLIVGLTGFIVVPLRRSKVMTIPEFYERRFGRGVRIYGGLILVFSGILNMGLFLKFGAVFIAGLTGLHEPILVNIIMTVLLALVLSYTILGGMISVVITDYIQYIVLSAGMLLACGMAVHHLGWSAITDAVKAVHGTAGFDPFDAGGFGITYVIWMVFLGLVGCAIWQTAVMRACAAADERVVKRLYCWSSIGFLVRMMVPQFLGICAIAFLWNHEHARHLFFTADGAVVNDPNLTVMAMPLFLGHILPVGIIGLVGAGMLAAFMATHDSYLLCWAAVLIEDVVNPLMAFKLSTRARLGLARLFILLIGVFLLVWGLWYPLGQDLWDYMAISGAIYFTGAAVLLVCGLYWKGSSRVGAYAALTCGGVALVGLGPVQKLLGIDRLQKVLDNSGIGIALDSATIGLAALFLAVACMVLFSLLYPDRPDPAGTETRT